MREVWKDVEGYEGYYQVSSFGNVRSIDRVERTQFRKGVVLKQHLRGCYLKVILSKKGKTKQMSVHRLVCENFHENLFNKPQVNHKNGNKLDNRCENLEWVTVSENGIHSFEKGFQRPIRGENKSNHKLKDEQVLFIRNSKGLVSQRELSKIFGVSESLISEIVNNKRRKAV